MDDDTKAIAIGLGAGLGGFAGFLILGCICWQICCGSWCEKKTVQSKVVSIPVKTQRHITMATKVHNNISTITPMRTTNTYSDLKANDLATSHFLGGSFTYRHIQRPINDKEYKTILVEIRFHISDHYFMCTPEQVNHHMILYLIGESVPYDENHNEYLWYETEAIRKNKNFYNIECSSERNNRACQDFQEKTWAYCESTNQNSGYSILRRQFLLTIERFNPIQLRYSSCCWANSSDKYFYFDLSIDTKFTRNNSSPYPYIPASYYVDFYNPREIKIFVYDADGDEIVCERYEQDLGKFLTVHVDNDCKLIYQTNRLGKQFGQFWLMDRNKKQILSRSLISIQVHVLKDIICNTQPELIIKNQVDHSNISTIKIKQTIYISVSINPNCLLIQPQDQTITELTTLCTNNQPNILANGGIEIIFQCTPYLCEKYQVCFVGEFGLKLPSTKIECFSIEVIGTEDECEIAARNYDFLKPRSRHFDISKPVNQKLIGKIQTTSSSSRLFKITKTTLLSESTISLSSEPQSRRWLWILIALMGSLLLGLIGYFGLKPILSRFYRHSLKNDKFHSSNRGGSYATIEYNMATIDPNTNKIDTPITPSNEYNPSPNSSAKIKIRSQRLRLGPLEQD